MMKTDYLSRLDTYFEEKKPSEAMTIFVGCGALIAFLIYLFCYEPSEVFYNEKLSNHNDVTSRLDNTKMYLASVSSPDGDRNFKISQETAKVNNLIRRYENIIKYNAYFDERLKGLSSLLFNEQNWAKFLNRVVVSAQENNIKIFQLKNDIRFPDNQKIEQVLNVDLTFFGEYHDVLNYINSLEESKLVVDINKLDINTTGNQLGANIYISVWGMRYQ